MTIFNMHDFIFLINDNNKYNLSVMAAMYNRKFYSLKFSFYFIITICFLDCDVWKNNISLWVFSANKTRIDLLFFF